MALKPTGTNHKIIQDLYSSRKLANFKNRHSVVDLAFPNVYNIWKAEKPYNLVMVKYLDAEAATGRIARQIATHNEIDNNSILNKYDLIT